jgi:hypothetical protein
VTIWVKSKLSISTLPFTALPFVYSLDRDMKNENISTDTKVDEILDAEVAEVKPSPSPEFVIRATAASDTEIEKIAAGMGIPVEFITTTKAYPILKVSAIKDDTATVPPEATQEAVDDIRNAAKKIISEFAQQDLESPYPTPTINPDILKDIVREGLSEIIKENAEKILNESTEKQKALIEKTINTQQESLKIQKDLLDKALDEREKKIAALEAIIAQKELEFKTKEKKLSNKENDLSYRESVINSQEINAKASLAKANDSLARANDKYSLASKKEQDYEAKIAAEKKLEAAKKKKCQCCEIEYKKFKKSTDRMLTNLLFKGQNV